MQDKHMDDFDLQVRSMLADAAEKPSRRVWKAVSARLDADAAPAAPVWGWVKWAGLGLATAVAALALGIFLPGTKSTTIPTIYHNQEQAPMLAQAGESAAAPATAGVTADAPAQERTASVPSVRRSASRPAAGNTVTEPAAPAVQATVEPSNGTPDPVASADKAPATEKSASPTVKETAIPTVDPFAPLGQDAPRKALRRPSLYAQGAVGGNESSGRLLPPASRMAPGTSEDFTEQGASSYGIPFTLGLGVRFYVAPRLSIGTGIDYSLLTRTFTGNFGDVSGSVSHSLQYLGVPLNLYFDILGTDKIKFYAYAGGELEYCISNKYKLFATPDIIKKYPVDKLQYSVGGGLGVEFRLGRHMGLYLDPGLQYYFPGGQPKSIRTERPLMVNFDAGLRFNF